MLYNGCIQYDAVQCNASPFLGTSAKYRSYYTCPTLSLPLPSTTTNDVIAGKFLEYFVQPFCRRPLSEKFFDRIFVHAGIAIPAIISADVSVHYFSLTSLSRAIQNWVRIVRYQYRQSSEDNLSDCAPICSATSQAASALPRADADIVDSLAKLPLNATQTTKSWLGISTVFRKLHVVVHTNVKISYL